MLYYCRSLGMAQATDARSSRVTPARSKVAVLDHIRRGVRATNTRSARRASPIRGPAGEPGARAIMVRSFLRRLLLATVVGCALVAPSWSKDGDATGSGALAAYIARPDASFALREVGSGQVGSAEFVEYLMTSQTWRGIPWKHQLFVLRPAKLPKGVRHGLLVVGGGRWKPEYEGERKQATLPGEALLFAHLAEAIAAPVAVLRQVPFQPLFERTEDALIAYTFDQYLKTG